MYKRSSASTQNKRKIEERKVEKIWKRFEEKTLIMEINPPTRKKGGRLKQRFMNATKDDLKVIGLIEKDTTDPKRWRRMICCGDYCMERAERRRLCALRKHKYMS